MKQIIAFLFSLFVIFNIQAQVGLPLNVAVKYQINNPGSTGTSPNFTVSGFISDDLSKWDATNISIGDSLYVLDGSELFVFVISSIPFQAGSSLTANVTALNNELSQIPAGQAAIIHPTGKFKYPTYISTLRDDLRSAIMNRFSYLLDQEMKAGDKIAYTLGFTPPANSVATVDGYRFAKINSGDGDLYKWDGTAWILDRVTSFTSGGALGFLELVDNGVTYSVLITDIAPVQDLQAANNDFLVVDNPGGVVTIKLAQQGATVGQVLKWNGSQWEPANDSGGSGGGLTDGNFGDITVSGSGTVMTLNNNTVDSTNISNKSISVFDIGQNGASTGQVLKWNGNMWIPSTDAGGGGGATDLSITGTSSPLTLNSSTGNDVTITAGSGVSLTGTSGNITINNTGVLSEVDGSVTNELQTISVATNTVTLSNSGGSATIAGAGINTVATAGSTITVTGTEVDGNVSNEGSLTVGVGTGTTSIINSNTSGSTGVTITAGTGISISEAGNIITLTNSSPNQTVSLTNGGGVTISGTYPSFTLTATDQSITNEVVTISDGTNTEAMGGQTLVVSGAGINTTSYNAASNTLTVTGTEIDGSVSNELQTISASGAGPTSYNIDLSNSGGSITLTEGPNMNLTRTGNTITFESTASGGGGGTVTSVGVTAPTAEFDVTNSPVTISGTINLAWDNQTTNKVLASPDGTTGQPSFRSLVATDIPNLATTKITGLTEEIQDVVGPFVVAGSGISSTYNDVANTLTIANTGVITEVDGSLTNEGQIGVGAGGASSSVLLSNTSGATGVTINVAGINTISETTSSNGGQITITATEVDGSTSNELQTYGHAGTTSYTNTLSNGGGSFTLQASGIATVNNSAGTVTIGATEVDGSTTNEVLTITDGTNSEALGGQTLTVTASGGAAVTYTPATNTLNINAGSSSGGDNWGSQVVVHGSTLTGNGVTGTALDVATGGITATELAVGSVDLSTTDVTGTLPVNKGGTGATTAQSAINTLAGGVTSGSYLRGNGTNIVLSTIQAADVPTLNQNTTGTASNVTGIVAIANGGHGQTTATAGFNALDPLTTLGDILIHDGTNSARLAGNITTTKQFLVQTGNGSVSAAPGWGVLAVGDIPAASGGDVTGLLSNLQIGTGVVGSTEVTDNSLVAGDLAVNVVSSIDGVTNDGADIDFVSGGIVTITPNDAANTITISATEIDGSVSNELQTISVSANTTTLSNSGGSMTIAGAGINTVGTAGSTITITGTEVDGSVTNELQTIANTSDATSHTVTLSNSGGSVQLVEGANITLTTSGTGGAGIVTIAASGGSGATDLTISGTSSPLTLNSSTGTDVTLTGGSTIALAGTSSNVTISVPTGGITGTELATSSVDLASTDVTGTNPVTKGGTGVASLTGIVKGNGTSAFGAATAGTDYSAGTSALATGILKSTTTTGALSIAVAGDFPTLNQNTTGSATSFTGALSGDVTGTQSATVVGKINGVSLAGLSTGILKNTTTTGVPSIAIAADFPILNQNTTGNAATVTTNANLTGPVTSVGNATTITANSIGNTQMADNAVASAEIVDGSVALSDMANMATSSLIYRKTAGTGAPEVNTLATLKTDLGLTGTNSGDQTITLTGDVTGSGSGSFATTIAANAVGSSKIADGSVVNADLANMAAHTYKGNNTGSSAVPIDVTATQLTADLDLFSSTLKGVVPASGGGTSNFLRADGTWAAAGGGSVPSGTDKQTLYYSGTTLTATSNLQNNGTEVAIGTTPVSGTKLLVDGYTLANGTVMSNGSGVPISSTSAAALRLNNTTATTGQLWNLGSMNNGQLRFHAGGFLTSMFTPAANFFQYGNIACGLSQQSLPEARLAVSDSIVGTVFSLVENKLSNSGAHAKMTVKAQGAGAGDAYTEYVAAGVTFTQGISNSITGDPFVIGASATLGTNKLIELHPTNLSVGLAGATASANKVTIAAGTTTAAPLVLTSGTNTTTVVNGAIEYDGTNYFISSGSTRYTVNKMLRNAVTLDFPSTGAGGVSDRTVTVTGAAVGDLVTLGAPNVLGSNGGVFFAWVSAANTVTVRFANTDNSLLYDPASGNFRVAVTKF